MRWTQNHWTKGKADSWIGVRADGRSFRIHFYPRVGYVVLTFNLKRIGRGETLAEAQKVAQEYMAVKPAQEVANAG